MSIKTISTFFLSLIFVFGLYSSFVPNTVAQTQTNPGDIIGDDADLTNPEGAGFDGLDNPIKVSSLAGLVEEILNIVLTIGVPIVAFFLIYSGFSYVTARGKPEALEKANRMFLYTIIGAALLLGAWVIAEAVAGTIAALKS